MDPASLQTLASHFSKEVELATQMIIEQRTKNNLVTAFGPFLILGAIASSSHAIDIISKYSQRAWFFVSPFLLLSYSTLGYVSAQIELNIWQQANKWREELATLYGMNKEVFIYPPNGLVTTYVAIYSAIGVAFMAMFLLIVRKKSEQGATANPGRSC